MKKIIFFCIFLLASGVAGAQNAKRSAELSIVARTWGFLKYYHPAVASGKINWDSVLIAGLPLPAHVAIDEMLLIAGPDTAKIYWITNPSKFSSRNYDLSWIRTNKLLTERQKRALLFIQSHPHQGPGFYTQPDPGDDNTAYTPNEKPYTDRKLPNTSYRLLGLFRFWNFIEYFYPYKYLIGQPWGKVLEQLIPVMSSANDSLSYAKAIARMAASINDSHGGLWPQVYNQIAGKYSPPFNFRVIGNKAVVTRLPDSVPIIHNGDVIEQMDGISVAERISRYWPYVPGSSPGSKIRDMHAILLNSHRRFAILSGTHAGGKRFTATVPLRERNFIQDYPDFFDMKTAITGKLLRQDVGYVIPGNVTEKNIDSVLNPLMSAKAIIFDLRKEMHYFYSLYKINDYLMAKPAVYAMATHPDFHLPGMFRYDTANAGTPYARVGRYNPNPYRGKVILLVDERTQSVMEWAAMIIQTAPNVTVIGSPTAGADGNVTRTVLPGNYHINLSGLGIYTPKGGETQRRGIRIDIAAPWTLSDVRNKTDPALRAALRFADGIK